MTSLTGLGGDLGVGQDLYLDPGLSLQYTQAYSSLRVGSIAVSWREGVGDLGLWSRPVLCSWHRTVCRGAELQLAGGRGWGALDCGLSLNYAPGIEQYAGGQVCCRQVGKEGDPGFWS